MRPKQVLALCVSIAWLMALTVPVLAQNAARLVVAPGGVYTTIAAALAAAKIGDVIEVRGGVYAAPLLVDKSVSLIGVDNPVIDGGGQGNVVIIAAPDVLFQGFIVRNSGNVLAHEETGIYIQAAGVTVADNVLENVLFGIYFAQAPNGSARHNTIHGWDLPVPLRGDGFSVWYSDHVTLDNNEVFSVRDNVIWYAESITIINNHFHDNRYGLHFMYSSHADIEGNTFENNSVGSYLMSSSGLTLRNNILAYNRGPSGYGLALKDMDKVVANDNLFVGNRAGLFIDNSPYSFDVTNTYTDNVFAYNDIGVTMLPATERNLFQRNTFLENEQQVSVHGRGTLTGNIWTQDGVGNYWSDYTGYDKDSDGVGELPYRAEKLFESLADTHPELRLFAYSPATQAIDFAAAAFPSLRPEPKLVDTAPLTRYHLPARFVAENTDLSLPLLGISLVLVLVGGGVGVLAFGKTPFTSTSSRLEQGAKQQRERSFPSIPVGRRTANSSKNDQEVLDNDMTIIAEQLTKRYGTVFALNGVSFTIQPGEAVALWGDNGAGKTTALRCLLGVLPFEGRLTIKDVDVRRRGKQARALIGYVPQEAIFYDLTVQETLKFYARLKKVTADRIEAVLNQVQLSAHARKPVRALSGGMKQRLALAVALLSDPPILVLDEPTASLDAKAQRDFIQMVKTLNQSGKTIVFSSHRLDEVTALAGRVMVLSGGQLALECPPQELAKRLGLQQWLRIQIPDGHKQAAVQVLREEGFALTPNGTAVYVHIHESGKVAPLRLLEAAQIPVDDFDLVDHDRLTGQDETP